MSWHLLARDGEFLQACKGKRQKVLSERGWSSTVSFGLLVWEDVQIVRAVVCFSTVCPNPNVHVLHTAPYTDSFVTVELLYRFPCGDFHVLKTTEMDPPVRRILFISRIFLPETIFHLL